MIARVRADARITQREALLTLGSTLRFPLEVDDDGSEYLRPTSDTTLDVHVDDARIALDELRPLISNATGWTLVASE